MTLASCVSFFLFHIVFELQVVHALFWVFKVLVPVVTFGYNGVFRFFQTETLRNVHNTKTMYFDLLSLQV